MVCTENSSKHYASNLRICLIFLYLVGLIELRRLFIFNVF